MITTWEGEKKLYERQFYAVLRRKTRIIDIKPPEDEIGYTSEDGSIHLAEEHSIMVNLDEKRKAVFRYGVFTHETLHQIFTDFDYLKSVAENHLDPIEREIIVLYANLVEDPSIEFFASEVFGGEMLEALRFSIRWIYQASEKLEKSNTPFLQFINALVMFGDMGLLKGKFTFPEAKEYFSKIAPAFNEAVENPDPKVRIDQAVKWMDLTRPLWEKEIKKPSDLKRLENDLQKRGSASSPMTGSGGAKETPGAGEKGVVAKRRDDFAKSLRSEGRDVGKANSGENKVWKNGKEVVDEFTDDVLSHRSDGDISPETVESIWMQVEETARKYRNNPAEESLDLPVTLPRGNGMNSVTITCFNNRVVATRRDADIYQERLNVLGRDIQLLTSSLRRIIQNDNDEYVHGSCGKYVIKRDLDHTSVNVFDKKREEKNINDLAVMLLIDISGSMSGKKIELARDASILLAESFAALKVPFYTMGFTADTSGYQVYHNHYVTWKNTKAERMALSAMSAVMNNDDAYSIRYAALALRKFRAEHKLLFVLSDGAPVCLRYSAVDGIKETAMSIREADKVADIVAIGIGNHFEKSLREMYHGSFLELKNIGELSLTLTRQIKRILRSL